MSLLLVLAMVLAMVPAALAANQAYSVEPGSTITLTTTNAFTGTTWTSSDPTVAKIESSTPTTAVIKGVTASKTAVTITASGEVNNQTRSETFTVYVQDAYSLTLSISSGNINNTIELNKGETRTLTATVALANDANADAKLANCQVQFTSDHSDVIGVPSDPVSVVKTTSGRIATYKAVATVTATGEGGATVTAQVKYKNSSGQMVASTSKNATKKVGFSVSGATTTTVTLPESQQILSLEAKGKYATLQPKVSGYSGTTKPTLMYLFDDTNNNLYVRPTDDTSSAKVEPYKACQATKIYICLADYNSGLTYAKIDQNNPTGTTASGKQKIKGGYAVCTVSIQNAGASVTALNVDNADPAQQLKLAQGTLFFGKLDPYKYNSTTYKVDMTNGARAETSLITESITLRAQITAPASLLEVGKEADLANAYSRIQWTSSNTSVVEVTGNGQTATLTPKAAGSAAITATVDTNAKATYAVTVYEGRAYIVTTPPALSGTVGKASKSVLESRFAQLKAIVEVQTSQYEGYTATQELPLENVKANLGTTGKVSFTYGINGIKGNEIYYSREQTTNSYTAGPYDLSDISLDTEPANASYKLTDTIANLVVEASTGSSTFEEDSFIWYMSSDQSNGDDTVIYQDKGAKGQNSYTSVLSNLKQYITGTGTYVFYCRVKAGSATVDTRKAIITITGENHINIVFNPTSVGVGGTFTVTGTPQEYVSGKLTNVTGKSYTITWTSSDENIVKLSSKTTTSSSPSVTATARAGGQVTIKAETTIGAKKYAAEVKFTVTVPEAETVSLTLGENDTYVLLDGSKLAAAVKTAAKTTPSSFTFESPSNGTLYTTSAMSSTVSTTTKYSASEVSKMVYRPTRTTGTHTIKYAAYDGSAQIATGNITVLTSASTVEYHISANETQPMVVSDFQRVYGSGLSSVTFGTNSNSHGALYKGSTTGSGKVGSESYSVSTSTNQLKNVCFIADSTVTKYTVTIPFTATGSSGQKNGQLVVYVNDTHTLRSVGASFRSMGIAEELAPENATSSTYITIDRVTGGRLYSSYTSIKSCTALTSKDFGTTKFYFTGSGSLDNLYILPLADSKSVVVSYTIDGSTKGTLSFNVSQQTVSSQFTDVSGDYKWAANSVDFMYTNDIIKGNSTKNPKLFGPGAKMTRAMLVTVLYRAAGEPTVAGITNKFTDNKQGQYYYNAVLWASNMGIVNGATATTFDPNGNITREQIAAILYRYAGSPTVTGSLSGYADQAQVSSFAVTAMQWAVGKGIITGIPSGGKTNLSAKGNATRAQVAVMLHRFMTFE